MALIFLDKSSCSLCNEILKTSDEIVSWNAFLKKDHKFWKYSDSGMHKSCFDEWECKEEFEHLYRYQPLLDFNDPYLKEQIKIYGIPDWLEKIIAYRKSINNK